MILKKLTIAFVFVICPFLLYAQGGYEEWKRQKQAAYDNYKQRKIDEYNDFRRKANEDYANFLKQRWEDMQAFKGRKLPKEPKPPRPVVAPISKIPTSDPLPVVPMPIPSDPPPVVLPDIPDVPLPDRRTLHTSLFYGVDLSFDYNAEIKQLKVGNIERGGLSDVWLFLSKRETDALVHDCIEAARSMKLPDWGYLTLVRCVSVELLGHKYGDSGSRLVERLNSRETDEAVLLEAYILSQSGYRTRLATGLESGCLRLLLAISEEVCEMTYFTIEGERYYVIGNEEDSYHVCQGVFEGSRPMSMQVAVVPQLGKRITSTQRSYNGKRYSQLHYDGMSINGSLMDFYTDYPLPLIHHWALFSRASLSDELKGSIYPDLRRAISGKSKPESADVIIDFVQQAFEYATDGDQFGYERPLFGDETFYYPYSDCEDRAILYSILIRELLGLDVVLIHFPGHMGTAVHFDEAVDGDYLIFEGRKYIICDPTYIGATIGMCMPQYKKDGVEIEVLPIR